MKYIVFVVLIGISLLAMSGCPDIGLSFRSLTSGLEIQDTLTPTEPFDTFDITITGNREQMLHVYTTGTTDTEGEIRDVANVMLKRNSNGAGGSDNNNFEIRYPVTAGTYIIVVSSGRSNPFGAYGLVATVSPINPITLGTTTDVPNASAANYFSLTVPSSASGQMLYALTPENSTGSPRATFLNSNADVLNSSNTYGTGTGSNSDSDTAVAIPLPTANSNTKYYLQMTESIKYRLLPNIADIPTLTLDNGSASSEGSLGIGEGDYYAITVVGSGTLTASTTSGTATDDTVGALLNSRGGYLVGDDDSGSNRHFSLSHTVSANSPNSTSTFYIQVLEYNMNEAISSYTLNASFN